MSVVRWFVALGFVVGSATAPILALASDQKSNLKEDARKAGKATGNALHEVGQGLKQVGKEVGSAAKEGGKELRRAIKGN